VIGARFVDALGELAEALIRESMPAPAVVADGSSPGVIRLGLLPCPVCGTPQRTGAVHFASNTDIRPCVGSWGRR